MGTFAHDVVFKKEKYTISYQIDPISYNNCGLRQLGRFKINDSKGYAPKDDIIYAFVDSEEFEKLVMGDAYTSNHPTGFFVSGPLNYARHSYSQTSQLMEGIIRGKRGAYFSTPLYDNKAHPNPGDSLQFAIVWIPEPNVGHIVSTKVPYRLKKKNILSCALHNWRKIPGRLSIAVDEVIARSGLKFKNLIPPPEEKKDESGQW